MVYLVYYPRANGIAEKNISESNAILPGLKSQSQRAICSILTKGIYDRIQPFIDKKQNIS